MGIQAPAVKQVTPAANTATAVAFNIESTRLEAPVLMRAGAPELGVGIWRK
jgi:hypothetical protein